MVSGMVTSTASKSPLRGSCKSKQTQLGMFTQAAGLVSYRPGDVVFPVPVTSFRSGAGYIRAMSQAGQEIPMSNNELLNLYATDDIGHEYKKAEYLKCHSNFVTGPQANFWGPVRAGSGGEILCSITPSSSGLGAYLGDPFSTPSWAVSDSHLEDLGQNLVLDYDPIRVKTDLLQDVGDILREGLPLGIVKVLLKGNLFGRPEIIRQIAGGYLTYIFGVKPIIDDVRAILKAAHDIDVLINEWIRNNHRQVRRRRQFPVKVTSSYDLFKEGTENSRIDFSAYLPTSHPWSSTGAVNGLRPCKVVGASTGVSGVGYRVSKMSVLKEKLRFSAAYEYQLERLLPGDDFSWLHKSSNSDLKELIRLHYLGISSSGGTGNLIWELAPWSWIIDWFVNIGKMFDYERQVQSVGLHVDYAYVTQVQEKWFKVRSELFKTTSMTEANLMYRHDIEFKQIYMRRLKATPFGFKVKFNGLSAQQLLTLGALALSRVPI